MSVQKQILKCPTDGCIRDKVSGALSLPNEAGEEACPTCGEVLE